MEIHFPELWRYELHGDPDYQAIALDTLIRDRSYLATMLQYWRHLNTPLWIYQRWELFWHPAGCMTSYTLQ